MASNFTSVPCFDRDFRSDVEADQLTSEAGVHVLACHEIENVFLQPERLRSCSTVRAAHESASTIVKEAADHHAGLWIAQRAAAALVEGMSPPKGSIGALSDERWTAIDTEWAESCGARQTTVARTNTILGRRHLTWPATSIERPAMKRTSIDGAKGSSAYRGLLPRWGFVPPKRLRIRWSDCGHR